MSLKRFVILAHDWDGVHYDLMFEADGQLRTWKIPAPPSVEPQPATLIFDHRIDYLTYEGPVSGGRGTVKRWDAGAYEGDPKGQSPIRLKLEGRKCNGVVELRQVQGDQWEISMAH